MGGDEFIRKDPAIEQFAAMRENIHLYWRPRWRRAVPLLTTLVVIPLGLYYAICWGFVPFVTMLIYLKHYPVGL
jgi:hypothetical protein